MFVKQDLWQQLTHSSIVCSLSRHRFSMWWWRNFFKHSGVSCNILIPLHRFCSIIHFSINDSRKRLMALWGTAVFMQEIVREDPMVGVPPRWMKMELWLRVKLVSVMMRGTQHTQALMLTTHVNFPFSMKASGMRTALYIHTINSGVQQRLIQLQEHR